MRILITGAFGWTAFAIVKALYQAGHSLSAFDLPTVQPSSGILELIDRVSLGTVEDFEAVHFTTRSVDAIIHLAVAIGKHDYESPDMPFSVNVRGTYNVFESARLHGIEKVVMMSEAAVHLPQEEGEYLHAEKDWRSSAGGDHLYDLTKRLQEEIARDFCETYGMNVVVLRAGHIVDGQKGVDPSGRSLPELNYCRGGWVCRYDLAVACVKAIEMNNPGYHAFHVIGAVEAQRHFDLIRTEKELGFVPQIRFENFSSTMV